ncbi:MAG TPA: 2-C-methyl-D-erythritol 4-phosphate cytidylyltransferase [Candidatus Dojkabacteria bacterium]|nr:2-C-methyl-D-erythritol 4-phosphate cytidylyltransferase [Candidatus Dojkabacteria bacterium]
MEHTLVVFEEDEIVDEIFIVAHLFFRYLVEEMNLKNSYKKVSKLLNGGSARQESSKAGIYSVLDDDSYVLIHGAVRPFVTHKIIKDIVNSLEIYESVNTCICSCDKFRTDKYKNNERELWNRRRNSLALS